MAEQEAKDLAAKKRIVEHMNADHHESVSLLLTFLCNSHLIPGKAYPILGILLQAAFLASVRWKDDRRGS